MIWRIDSILLGWKPWGLYTCEAVTMMCILPYVHMWPMYHNYHKLGSAPPYLDGSMCWTNASSTTTPLRTGPAHTLRGPRPMLPTISACAACGLGVGMLAFKQVFWDIVGLSFSVTDSFFLSHFLIDLLQSPQPAMYNNIQLEII